MKSTRSYRHLLIPSVILLVTFLCFLPTLQNGWVNWDDPAYILENSLIKSDAIQWREIFAKDQILGIYHPITLLSYAIDYQFWELDPFGYHLTNLVFHLFNTLFVFLVFRKLKTSLVVAGCTALLFGIHPMHVESVTWISERKDVLYLFFFLLAWLSYQNYRSIQGGKKWGWYFAILVLFSLSILSKPIAFVFPAVLILSDYLATGSFRWKALIDKIPIIILSIVALLIARWGQADSNSFAIASAHPLSPIFYGSYNLIFYLFKAAVPIQLSAFHPFPMDNSMNWLLYGSIIPFIGLIWFVFYAYKKSKRIFFGMLFFIITIAPLLQIIPFGKALSSERYTYLAYLGLFYLFAIGIEHLIQKQVQRKTPLLIAIAIFALLLFVQNYQQQKIWKDSEALWSSIIEQYPDAYYPYLARGRTFQELKQSQKAYDDFTKSLELTPNAEAFYERGILFQESGQTDLALNDYLAAAHGTIPYPKARVNAARILAIKGNLDQAKSELIKAISEDPSYPLARYNLSVIYKIEQQPKLALKQINKAIALETGNITFVEFRAAIYTDLQKHSLAIEDFERVLQQNANNRTAQYYTGLNYHLLDQEKKAKYHYLKALKLGYPVPEEMTEAYQLAPK